MVESLWKKVLENPLAKQYKLKIVPSAKTDMESIIKCRNLCAENKCGMYDASWTCPPGVGSPNKCISRLNDFSKTAVIYRRYEVDFNDATSMQSMADNHQQLCRTFVNFLRENGYDALPLSGGRCTYCKVCTYPDESCPYPEQQVPSCSGYGVNIESFLKSNDIDFKFENNAMTLYGLIFFEYPTDSL